jgi:hypothetical protein
MHYKLNVVADGENQVRYYLEVKGIAPIFFGDNTIDQIRNNTTNSPVLIPMQQRDAQLFVDTFGNGINNDAIIVATDVGRDGMIYFCRQNGPLAVYGNYQHAIHNGTVKGFPIEIIQRIRKQDSPILAGMYRYVYLRNGTFKEIVTPILIQEIDRLMP